ncbi:MAG: hypothetical protein ACAI35_12610 [Candidatus Methylacidiphilales bacterium]|nr:hypothetical protein [Candidatus Methylacidiphilales bacterium]
MKKTRMWLGIVKTGVALTLVTLFCAVTSSAAPVLVCEGILGNSGGGGDTLVRYTAPLPQGAGVAVDEYGFLWATGGPGRINRYALDGRQIATYTLPSEDSLPKRIIKAGDKIVVLAKGELFTRSTALNTTEAFTSLEIKAAGISSNAVQGKIACWQIPSQKDEPFTLFLTEVTGGTRTDLAEVPGIHNVEMAADGSVLVEYRGVATKYGQDGKLVSDWNKKLPGTGLVRAGDYYYCFTHSSTIQRLSADLVMSPGVVLGGASGSVIAKMPIDADIRLSTGLAHVSGNIYAVAGYGGTVMLLAWNEEKAQFSVQRRIGGLPCCSGLYLSPDGWVVANAGAWSADARPDSPLEFGSPIDPDGMRQPVMLRGVVIAPAFRYGGRPNFLAFSLKSLSDLDDVKVDPFTKKAAGAAVVILRKQDWVLVAEQDGVCRGFRVSSRGSSSNSAKIPLETSSGITSLTSIASPDGLKLYAAADGAIVEFAVAPEETGNADSPGGYTEKTRWKGWGTAESETFGGRVYVAADKDRVWISDTEKNRVLCFGADKQLIAAFTGEGDEALDKPTVISANAEQAVVYDSGKQRIVKLKLLKDKTLAGK